MPCGPLGCFWIYGNPTPASRVLDSRCMPPLQTFGSWLIRACLTFVWVVSSLVRLSLSFPFGSQSGFTLCLRTMSWGPEIDCEFTRVVLCQGLLQGSCQERLGSLCRADGMLTYRSVCLLTHLPLDLSGVIKGVWYFNLKIQQKQKPSKPGLHLSIDAYLVVFT